jgi:hypothetical protein
MTNERSDEVAAMLLRAAGINTDSPPTGGAALSSRTVTGEFYPPSMLDLTGQSNRPPPYLNPNSPQSGNPNWSVGKQSPREEKREFHDLSGVEVQEVATLLRRAAQTAPGAAAPWNARWASLTGEVRRLLKELRDALGAVR